MSRRRPRVVRDKGVIAAARRQRVPAGGERLAFRSDRFTRRVLRPVLIAALATSVAVAVLVIARIITPDLPWLGLVPLCFLAALEGTYTAAWLNNPDSHGVDRGIYRVTELLLLLVVARVYSWVLFGGGIPTPVEMRLFLTAPVSILTTAGFVTTAVVTLVAWWLGVSFGRLFARLEVSVYELGFYTLSQAEQKAKADDRPIHVARDTLQNQYLSTWLYVGMAMILLAALSTFEVNQLATVNHLFDIVRLGLTPAMLYALMVYFLTGLWLLSHARLLRMNARWLIDGVSKDATLERGWQRSALLVVVTIALGAAFLPIGSTLAISQILQIGLAGFGYLVSRVFALFAFLFASVLMALTSNAEQLPTDQPPILPTPTPPLTPTPPPTPNPVLTMVITSAFWTIMIALVVAAFLFFLRERGYRFNAQQARAQVQSVAGWLRERWMQLTGRARRARRELAARWRAARAGPPAASPTGPARPRFIRLGALSPRDQVRYYYLALVRRASERGVARRDSQTPLEYGRHLAEAWPEADEDLSALTDAFLEARYSPQPIERTAAGAIRERWNRVKARLRRPS